MSIKFGFGDKAVMLDIGTLKTSEVKQLYQLRKIKKNLYQIYKVKATNLKDKNNQLHLRAVMALRDQNCNSQSRYVPYTDFGQTISDLKRPEIKKSV